MRRKREGLTVRGGQRLWVAGDPLRRFDSGDGGGADGEADEPDVEEIDSGEDAAGDPPAKPEEKKADPKKPGNKPDADRKKANDRERDLRLDRNKLRERLTQIEQDLAAERTERLNAERRAVAKEFGLPDAFVDRIKGDTVDEIKADARVLAEALPKAPPPPADKKKPSAGNPAGGTKLTLEMFKNMTAEQIAKLPEADVDAVLRGG